MTVLLRRVAPPLVAAGVLAVSACGVTHPATTASDDKTEQVAVADVRISGGAGDITLRPGHSGQVRIHRTIRYSGDAPSASTYRIEGSTLFLNTSCGRGCGVDYDVRVPEGVTVTGTTGAGDVRLTGVSKVDIDVHAGDVSVTRATGPVRIRVDSGDIGVTDVRAATTDLQAGFGDIAVNLSSAGSVTARTVTGDIRVRVPSRAGYRIDASTGAGDTKLGVPTDPNGAYMLSLQSTVGDIVVSPAAAG